MRQSWEYLKGKGPPGRIETAMAPTSDAYWEILTLQRMAGVCQVLAILRPSPVNKTGTLGVGSLGGTFSYERGTPVVHRP